MNRGAVADKKVQCLQPKASNDCNDHAARRQLLYIVELAARGEDVEYCPGLFRCKLQGRGGMCARDGGAES